jgi:hypothetical protein
MSGKERSEMKVIPGGNQMSLIRDTEEVLKFLEFAGRKSILNEHAINCRLTACNNLFSVLNEDEDSLEYILKNLDVLINRFRNRNTTVQASTLKVYKSRVKSSLEDFRAWSADPFAWERAITDKARAAGKENRKERKKKPVPAAPQAEVSASAPEPAPAPAPVEVTIEPLPARRENPIRPEISLSGRKVSFPIRADFCVEVVLPEEGITLKELHRLGLFLYPYCKDIDPDQTSWPR